MDKAVVLQPCGSIVHMAIVYVPFTWSKYILE